MKPSTERSTYFGMPYSAVLTWLLSWNSVNVRFAGTCGSFFFSGSFLVMLNPLLDVVLSDYLSAFLAPAMAFARFEIGVFGSFDSIKLINSFTFLCFDFSKSNPNSAPLLNILEIGLIVHWRLLPALYRSNRVPMIVFLPCLSTSRGFKSIFGSLLFSYCCKVLRSYIAYILLLTGFWNFAAGVYFFYSVYFFWAGVYFDTGVGLEKLLD